MNEVSKRDQFYFRAYFKNALFQQTMAHFEGLARTRGLTIAEVARRLNRPLLEVDELFLGPGKWTLEVASDLLIAMEAMPTIEITKVTIDG